MNGRRPRAPNYFPLGGAIVGLLLVFLVVLLAFIQVGAVQFAYARLGITPRHAIALLALSLLGSYVNVPVRVLEGPPAVTGRIIEQFGVRWVVPIMAPSARTVLAVNLGGAILPAIVSGYLLLRHGFYLRGLLATAVVALVVHLAARPVRGLGITVPTFLPPLVAAAAALVLDRGAAPALAYVCGTMGTLVGADLLNLGKIRQLGAPVVSIGGAGTFDGIFVTGILAVLLA